MADTVIYNIDGKPYEVPKSYTELDVRRALEKRNQAKNIYSGLSKPQKITQQIPQDLPPSDEFRYGIERKLRETLGGIKEFATGKPSMPLEADLPSSGVSQLARGAGKSATKLGETTLESLTGARIGSKFGPLGATIGAIGLPLIAGYLKQPGERLSGARALSAAEEALPSALGQYGKTLITGYKLNKAMKDLEKKEINFEEALIGANKYLTTTKEGIPANLPRTIKGLESSQLTKTEQLQNLQTKQQKLQEKIKQDEPFKSITFTEKGPKTVDLSEVINSDLPETAKKEIIEQRKNKFINEAQESFDPTIDYGKLAAEEHNKVYNKISEEVNNKYNDVLKGVDKGILAGSKGYAKYQEVAKAVGEKISPLKNLFPKEILTTDEEGLITGLEGSEKLTTIPTEKVLSFYKTAKQLSNKLKSSAWQEANGLTDVQRKNYNEAAKQFSFLSDKLGQVLDAINPDIKSKLSEADKYFAENKAPFYARKEHWEAQKGRLDSDVLKSTHADTSTAPEAGFLRNLIKTNENYRKAVLGKLFGRDLNKLTKEGEFEEYSSFIKSEPHVKNIHDTLNKFEKFKTQRKLTEPSAQVTQKNIDSLLKAKKEFSENLGKHLSEKLNTIKKLVEQKQKGIVINTEELIKTGQDIEKINTDIEKLENYKNNLLEAEQGAKRAGEDVKKIQIEIKKARYDLAQYKQKQQTIKKIAKGILGTAAAGLYLFKK